MQILFLTISDYDSLYSDGLYTNLLRQFIYHGDYVYIISPVERREGKKPHITKEKGATIVKPVIGNMQKNSFLEKGISVVTIEKIIIDSIKRYLYNVKFDLVIYTTPPITFYKAVKYIKNRDGAKTYLLLKDIFPQNAVDIGLIKKSGLRGILYLYFRKKEKQLYKISDYIGCMSDANVKYLLENNRELSPKSIEVCPNCTEPKNMNMSVEEKRVMRQKYRIPQDRVVFVYGGNLGKPQGIDFLIDCLKSQEENREVFFLIVGSGTDYWKLDSYIKMNHPSNVKLMSKMPKEDYDKMIGSCDIGMVFLDYRFTIPNFPCRILSYMQAKIPIFACTDPNSDVGKVIVEGGFGWWCESNNVEIFKETVKKICNSDIGAMGEVGNRYLICHYHVADAYNIISSKVKG
jgi:hypothetical protein